MNLSIVAAVVLILGSILFLIAAFLPVSMAFFSEGDKNRQLEIVTKRRQAWVFSQVLFISGAVVTALGIGLTAYQMRNLPESALVYTGFLLIVIGAVMWVWLCYRRGGNPTALVAGDISAWPFISYTLLTQAGLVLVGVMLLGSSLADWVGWMLIGGSSLCFVLFMVFKDVPPFVYYILTLITGIMLYRAG